MQEKICPVCKKTFIPAPLHIYMLNKSKLVCSWNCQIEGERKKEKAYLDRPKRK